MKYDITAKVIVDMGKEVILRRFLKMDPGSIQLLEELPEETVSLRRRRDIMRQSAAYEVIKEEGLKEGIQQGIQQGMQQGMRQSLLDTLEMKFETVSLRLIKAIDDIKDAETLRILHRHAMKCNSTAEFEEKMRLIIEG